MLKFFLGIFSKDIAIDLGTANTLISLKGDKNFIVNERTLCQIIRVWI